MLDDKYVVFKSEDFLDETVLPTDVEPITDAVVIRRQDMFAPPALHVYANSIAMAVKMIDINAAERKPLQAIADYFHEQAVLAEAEAWKWPD